MVIHDVAQICLNGHIINDAANTYDYLNKEYCDKCGSPTIKSCTNCNAEIQGAYDPKGEWGTEHLTLPPSYCQHCGKPFPWTVASIQATKEFIEELKGLSKKEKLALSMSINDLMNDTPRTELSALRVKKILAKLSEESRALFTNLLTKIATSIALDYLGFH